MQYIYPAVFHPEKESGYTLSIPDFPDMEQEADTVADCMRQAMESLSITLYDMEERGAVPPVPSALNAIPHADGDLVTYVTADTDGHRRYYDTRLVKKTLSIPVWINSRAEEAGINFSKLLTRALREELGIYDT